MKQQSKKIQPTKLDMLFNEICQKYPNKQDWMKLEYELGIDEAGRGAVMGPMVYGVLWWPKIYKQKFKEIGFMDSKQLKEEQRNHFFSIINKVKDRIFFYELQVIPADTLSKNMQKYDSVNLNIISHNAAIKLLRCALSQGFKITDVYVDTVGDPGKYHNYISERVQEYSHIIKNITVQPKADRDHPVVSAASICAKVTRDRHIKEWKFIENINFEEPLGSGYPSDPITKYWLQKYKNKIFGFPNLIRFSWQTCTNILQNYCQLKIQDQKWEEQFKGLNGLIKKQIHLADLVQPI